MIHDPDCQLVDKNHSGPHHVRPGHPKAEAVEYRCELPDCPNRMEQYEHYHTVVYVVDGLTGMR